MTADVRLYRSACAWCLPVLLVGLPSWPLAVLSALAWWLLGKVTIRLSCAHGSMRPLTAETSSMLQCRNVRRRRPQFVRLSVEVAMRVVMILLSTAMLAGNLIDGVWLGGDDLMWFWARCGVEIALGLVGAAVSMLAAELRERRGVKRQLRYQATRNEAIRRGLIPASARQPENYATPQAIPDPY